VKLEDFSPKDILVNIHGYEKWDKGLTKSTTTKLIQEFPGQVYGISEKGYDNELYGRTHIPDENIIESKPQSGEFNNSNLDLQESEYILLAGGEIGACHWETYEILNQEVENSQFILPATACYGYIPTPNPDEFLLYSLDELLNGALDNQTTIEDSQKLINQSGISKYDPDQTQIGRVF